MQTTRKRARYERRIASYFSHSAIRVMAIISLFLISAHSLSAQITTSSINGRVLSDNGTPVPQAEVLAVHVPTGARFSTHTDDNGGYFLPNVRAGGPYTVTVRRISFSPESHESIFLSLGTTSRQDFHLAQAAVSLAAVAVTGSRDDAGTTRSNATTYIGKSQIENLPTLGRSMQDMTRLTPSGNANSFAGSNFRYNNITVDGASANDVFGFSNSYGGIAGVGPSGTPGAAAKSQPISLDAIEQVRVAVAPFDVTLGNFTGASINAVTRSGTNEMDGSFYGFGRNQTLTGKSADEARTAIPAYHDFQFGGRVGGPIVKDKAFYFFNAESGHRHEPLGFAPGDPGTVVDAATAKAISDTLKRRLGYDAGSIGAYTIDADNTKLFGRLDFNLSDVNKLNIRHNFVNASAGQLSRAPTAVNFGSQDFVQKSINNSSVAELKSTFGNGVGNDLVAGLTFTRDHRNPVGQVFPQLEITGPSGSLILVGTNREAAVWGVNTNVAELTDNLTIYRGKNTFTLGTHNEGYGIQYSFLNSWNGRWQYSSIANFFADKPSRIRATYALGDNSYGNVTSSPSADFKVVWPSAYAQDEIAVSDRLHVTAGLRLDDAFLPTAPPVNQQFLSTTYKGTQPFANYNNKLSRVPYFLPRLSFNWDVNGDQSLQFRGGSGIYVGRIPFVWLANAYANAGDRFNNVDCRPGPTSGCAGNSAVVPLLGDGSKLSTLQSGVYEMDVIDNNFRMPTMNRSSLAADFRLPDGTKLTLEGAYTKTIKDVKVLNVGLKDSTIASPVDGRPIFLGSPVQQRLNPNITSVFVLTNTKDGSRYSLTASAARAIGALNLTGAYTYGQSHDVSNGIRNSLQSSWEFNQVADPRNPGLSASNFDLRHRVVASLAWDHPWSPRYGFGVSAVFTGSSGSPFTFTYTSDANRDGAGNNDLIYVPINEADARIVPVAGDTRTVDQIWQQLDAFINSQPGLASHRGKIAERNAGRTPWNKQLDLRLHQDLPAAGRNMELTFDLINALGLVKSTWGRQYFIPNENNYQFPTLRVTKTDATGAPIGFSFDGVTNNTPWQYDALNSRYQAQLGLRYSF